MYKHLKQILILGSLILVLILPYFIFSSSNQPLETAEAVAADTKAYQADTAKSPVDVLKNVGQDTYSVQDSGEPTNNIFQTVGKVITVALSIVGVLFLILMIYGGYLWMLDRGNEEQVKKAGKLIRAAVIGLIIVVAAYAITQFMNTYIITGTRTLQGSGG